MQFNKRSGIFLRPTIPEFWKRYGILELIVLFFDKINTNIQEDLEYFFVIKQGFLASRNTVYRNTWWGNNGTILKPGITCRKNSCCMSKSACMWLIAENVKIFWILIEIIESWVVYRSKFSWIIQSSYLTETIKRS